MTDYIEKQYKKTIVKFIILFYNIVDFMRKSNFIIIFRESMIGENTLFSKMKTSIKHKAGNYVISIRV